jgi:hypothetical protein
MKNKPEEYFHRKLNEIHIQQKSFVNTYYYCFIQSPASIVSSVVQNSTEDEAAHHH